MCGIAGFYSRKGNISRQRLVAATAAMAHRGPDDSGVQVISMPDGSQVGFGNRRLAIVDLSCAGHQPMTDPATGNWIAYNGEVFNFRELRAGLEQGGCTFVSDTDTEVLLKQYGRLSIKAFQTWRGMFAAAVWDAQRRKLTLVRDRFGIKPLYYSLKAGNLVFASEVRALLSAGLVVNDISRPAVFSYLAWGSVQDPLTIVDGLHALLPGHYLEFDGESLSLGRYWELPVSENTFSDKITYREVVEHTRELLEESVRMRLISDVPVGAFLSGGIDSSSVVSLMRRHTSRVTTFSIGFTEKSHDESLHARTVAHQFGTEHHHLPVTESDVLAQLPQALAAMDQPTIDGINTYFVSRATRNAGITVALSGLGGDEVFGGYRTFQDVPRLERYLSGVRLVPGSLRRGMAAVLRSCGTDRSRKLSFLIGDGQAAWHPYLAARCLFSPQQVEALVAPEIWDSGSLDDSEAEQWQSDLLRHASTCDSFKRISFLELRTYMANTLLRDTDFMSMAHSLEVRVPLIDHKLVEHVMRVPTRLIRDGNTPKKLLVDAVGDLPDSIVYREKFGFSFPWEIWLTNQLRPMVEDDLNGDFGILQDLLAQGEVRRQWTDFLGGRTSWSRPWALFVLQHWCESHLSTVRPAIAGAQS